MQELKSLFQQYNASMKPRSRLEILTEQAESYNSSEGQLTDIDCPKCRNKGYIQKVVFKEMYNDYTIVITECECMKKRRVLYRAKHSGLGEYINKRFSDYQVNEPWQKNIKEKAIKYAQEDNNAWFVSLGQSGAGKTLISCIIANYLLLVKNKELLYITWTDFISRLKRDMMDGQTKEVSDYLESIKNVEVLFIDELLKKYNETDLRYIIEIINYRYTKNLKTIITSERTINELLDIDEATFGRVVEKSGEYIINIQKDRAKNQRLKAVM